MGPEALQFGQESLSVGAQPIRLRKFLSDKFQTHLITKNVINLKQSLACNWNRSVQFWHVISCLFLPKGTADSKWHDTVEVLVELADENSKNIFNDSEGNEKCRANIALVLHALVLPCRSLYSTRKESGVSRKVFEHQKQCFISPSNFAKISLISLRKPSK